MTFFAIAGFVILFLVLLVITISVFWGGLYLGPSGYGCWSTWNYIVIWAILLILWHLLAMNTPFEITLSVK